MFPKLKKPKKIIYLDHAATTPLDPKVKKVMEPFWHENFGNPSSLYKKGREAKKAIDDSRKTIAHLINARPEEIIFTAGGTESNNLAIFGTTRMNTDFKTNKHRLAPHIITSTIEHHSVLRSFQALEKEGYKTTYIDVDDQGFINLDKLKKSVRPETILISLMYANNEIGTIEPIAEVGKWLTRINAERMHHGLTRILFHTDACQAAGSLDLNVNHLGVDLMTVNGSKIYGPKQTGFLYVRSSINIKPLIYGGGQEKDLRSGTENVPGIVGLAEAFRLSYGQLKDISRQAKLRDYFIKNLLKKIPKLLLNGPNRVELKVNNNQMLRLFNNINISVKGVEGEALMLYLDSYGVECATGSACATTEEDPSHVLLAIGRSFKDAKSSVRFTLGKATTKSEINYVLKILPPLVAELRKVKGL